MYVCQMGVYIAGVYILQGCCIAGVYAQCGGQRTLMKFKLGLR